MPLSESSSRVAIGIWAVTWLPGLLLVTWRMERLLRTRRLPRALFESVAVLLIPLMAFGVYALSDAKRYAQVHGTLVSWGALLSVAQVAMPYLASAAYLLWVLRPGISLAAGSRWWVALLLGLLSAIVLTPGLFMAQLMLFAGARMVGQR